MLSSILRFPNRGPYGDARYRGNCSGYVGTLLADWLKPKNAWDPMAGSGSVVQGLQASGVYVVGTDLRQGVDILSTDDDLALPVGIDLGFLHPPYWDIVTYNDDPRCLSRTQPYDRFIHQLNDALCRLFGALRSGGHLAVLVGDVVKAGRIYPIVRDIDWLGTPIRLFIKEQHRCASDARPYPGEVVRIAHEYLVVTRKPVAIAFPIRTTRWSRSDIRQRTDIPWRSLVATALETLGGETTLPVLYQWIAECAKTKDRPNWQAKVRQTLQLAPEFVSSTRGVWKVAARSAA